MDLSKMSQEELLQFGEKYLRTLIENIVSDKFEQRLSGLEKGIEQLHNSDYISQLVRETVQQLKQKNEALETELQGLRTQLTSSQKDCQRLSGQETHLTDQVNKLQKEVTAQQIQQQGYRKAVEMNISKILPFIDTRSYESYVYSLYDETHIALIYSNMKKDFEAGIFSYKECYEQLIGDYIEISRRICGKESVQWQKVHLTDFYDTMLFDKTRESKEIGRITRIIYKGLEKDGSLLGTCKSLVEVG